MKEKKGYKFKIIEFIITFFYSGKTKFAKGTSGSIATIIFWITYNSCLNFYFPNLSGLQILLNWLILLIFITIIGHFSIMEYLQYTPDTDPREVVIDEVLGQLISFMLSMLAIEFFSSSLNEIFMQQNETIFAVLLLVTPFVFFRFFDIKKPWLVGMADKKLHGSLGIMLDDVIAGIFAGLSNGLLLYFTITLLNR